MYANRKMKALSPTRPLTDRQRLFVKEYLIDFNGTHAASRAGYSPRTTKQMGTENLSKPAIMRAIQKELRRLQRKSAKKAEDVILELSRIGFSNIRDYLEWGPDGMRIKDSTQLDPEQAAAISEVINGQNGNGGQVTRITLHDKVRALIRLGQYFGLWDRKQVGVQILPELTGVREGVTEKILRIAERQRYFEEIPKDR